MERRYGIFGRVAHLFRDGSPPVTALCGISLWEHMWWGAGSQEEYEKAASLPTCKNCQRKMIP